MFFSISSVFAVALAFLPGVFFDLDGVISSFFVYNNSSEQLNKDDLSKDVLSNTGVRVPLFQDRLVLEFSGSSNSGTGFLERKAQIYYKQSWPI